MPDRNAIADEIERQLTLRDCPEHHTADLYLTPGKWRLVIAALRSKDREDGAREMRERAAQACRMTGDPPTASGDPLDTLYLAACGDCAAAVEVLPLTTRTEDGDA